MTEISIPEEEIVEPSLNYWTPASVASSSLAPDCIGNGYENSCWSYQVPTYASLPVLPPSGSYQQLYPLNYVTPPYIPNQQIGLPLGALSTEEQICRMTQYSATNSNTELYTLSANPYYGQDYHTMTDNMIQDEVTRAAKTLFSKRNRTLLHWLNPDINKNQIKVDTDVAWEMLPDVQKKFFISQVLGKFSPHVSSLMVNPQLQPSNVETPSSCMMNKFDQSELRSSTKIRGRRKKNPQANNKPDIDDQQKHLEIKTEDYEDHDSELVIDIGEEEKPKETSPSKAKRVKRKYTRRKPKENALEDNKIANSSDSNTLPVQIKDIKLENTCDLLDEVVVKVEPGTELSDNIEDSKEQSNKVESSIIPQPKCVLDNNQSGLLPKPKRKYVKRKLVRKKYTRREPKQKLPELPQNTIILPETVNTSNEELEPQPIKEEEIEMDLWIELEGDSILTNEEVDRFFDSIEDPDRLFGELGIIEN